MKLQFTVDTHIFRELGQYLVGRDSTALAELVKNTYDADATIVTVHGEKLDDPKFGCIRIIDNGNGMNVAEFASGFLRIAGRQKEVGDRTSTRFHRRLTGAKGIGRLAAQKLAGLMEIESISQSVPKGKSPQMLIASIDWDLIESHETLDQVEGTGVPTPTASQEKSSPDGANIAEEKQQALSLMEVPIASEAGVGTTITLKRLRQKWSGELLRDFANELDAFRPPKILTGALPKTVVAKELLFETPTVADAKNDEGYSLNFSGDFAFGETTAAEVAHAALWVLEIDATPKSVHYSIAPTNRTLEETPFAGRHEFRSTDLKGGPTFHSRILVRGRASRKDAATYSGVRIYMEGFRVLPYGDLTDDWLRLKQAVTDRTRELDLGAGFGVPEQTDEGLFQLPPKHYAGAVFLTQNRASDLQMVINREGFVSSPSFSMMEKTVRRGIDLLTRVRAQVAAETKRRDRIPLQVAKEVDEEVNAAHLREMLEGSLTSLISSIKSIRELVKHLSPADAKVITEIAANIEATESFARAYITENAFTRVLASLGLQLSAFVHELNALLGMAATLERSVVGLRDAPTTTGGIKSELSRIGSSVVTLRRTLERQASYLVDVTSPDARRRRARQPLFERFEEARRLIRMSADRKGITIDNEIPESLRTPAMFSSELIAVLSNLLTNAVKAAGSEGRIWATASEKPDKSVRFRLENTGIAVELSKSERWFKPFESTTSEIDPVLGQGMGLGLTISRAVLDEYRAKIRFVVPTPKYATAIEISFLQS